jgi:hypothetical protein
MKENRVILRDCASEGKGVDGGVMAFTVSGAGEAAIRGRTKPSKMKAAPSKTIARRPRWDRSETEFTKIDFLIFQAKI